MYSLDPKFSIVSYAVICTKFNESKNICRSFLPLLEAAIAKVYEETIEKSKLAELFKEIYGYKIPLSILDELLNILQRQNKISKVKHEKIEIHRLNIDEFDSAFELRLKRLINEFERFTITKGQEIDRNTIPEVIANFIYKNALEMNSFFKYTSNLENTYSTEKKNEELIVEFFLRERTNSSDCYKFIEEIYSGAIISTLLQFGESEICVIENDPFSIENAVLDSNFIFRLLDLQTRYEFESSYETYKLIIDNHCKLWVSPCTIKQIYETVTIFIKSISPETGSIINKYFDGEKFSGLYSAYIRRQLTPAKLQEIINSLEETLRNEFNVLVFDQSVIDDKSIDNDEFSSLLAAKPLSDPKGIIHDLQLVMTVRNQRATTITRMDQAKWWVITDDYKLTKWNQTKSSSLVPECIIESQLATLYWLNNPQMTTITGLCNTILALRNKDLYNSNEYQKITQEIETQRKRFEKSRKNTERLALLFSSQCLSLEDLISVESENVNSLFDNKLEEADKFVQDNQDLIAKHSNLQETADLFLKQLEEKKLEVSYKANRINNEIENHISTLRSMSDEKMAHLNSLNKRRTKLELERTLAIKKNDNKVIALIGFCFILILVIIILIETFTDIFTTLNNKFPTSLAAFILLFIFMSIIVLRVKTKEEIQNRIFILLSTWCFKKSNQFYDSQIKDIEDQKYILSNEISQLESKISELMLNKVC
jgi:hypothetical protein